ncbi:MAG TPA: glycosyltransferase [Thermoleophilaceae bacterium]|nr:glycosyltransferase [Thermoleophilaceae bacterium]
MAAHTDMKVDAVIPTYGDPSHLAEAIESVLAQTVDSWLLTIVYNDPGDGPASKTIEPYLDHPRVSCVPTREVLPQADNWSKAIQAGSAPYVAMLHDDDVWDPDYIERRVNFLDAQPACGFVFSSWREIDESGDELEAVEYRLSEGVHEPIDFVPVLFHDMLIGSPTIMVRRQAYEAVGPVFDGRFKNIDWEMWMRIAVRYPVGYLAVRDCGRRLHFGSLTSRSRGWGDEELALVDRFEEIVERELPELRLARRPRLRRRSAAHLMAAMDEIESGNRQAALRHLGGSLRTDPSRLVDPRLGAALAAAALGERGRRRLARVRAGRAERRITRR